MKKLNAANPGVLRPLRAQDLQNIWDAFAKIHAQSLTMAPRIISGFYDKGDGYLSEGVVMVAKTLYYHPDTSGSRIAIGANVYGKQTSGVDTRVFGDSTVNDFAYDMLANTDTSGTLIGNFSLANINLWRLKATQKERIVKGVLRFDFTNNCTFTPYDSSADSDIAIESISYPTTKTALIEIKDGSNVLMKAGFNIAPVQTTDMDFLVDAGLYPKVIMLPQSTTGFLFKWENSPTEFPLNMFAFHVEIAFAL